MGEIKKENVKFLRIRILLKKLKSLYNVKIINSLHIFFVYIRFLSIKNRICLSKNIKKAETKKYISYIKDEKIKFKNINNIKKQTKQFLKAKINLYSDKLTISDDVTEVVVIAVVKDELERMKLFYKHYHSIGVKQFVVLDNGSEDGTLEWVSSQNNTRVYQVLDEYTTQSKEAWIERILAMLGYGRWYMVVDADELLDYPGSETVKISDKIEWAITNGYSRLGGYLLDMYSSDEIYSCPCKMDEIEKNLVFFDKDSYILIDHFLNDVFVSPYRILGGPRKRVFETNCALSKQSVFYYDEYTLYRNCHFLLPLQTWEEVPCCYVLRHYKFLDKDFTEYTKRCETKNFASGSKEYIQYMDCYNKKEKKSFYNGNAIKYENSQSLRELPFLIEID